jgi:hypothetical protein
MTSVGWLAASPVVQYLKSSFSRVSEPSTGALNNRDQARLLVIALRSTSEVG